MYPNSFSGLRFNLFISTLYFAIRVILFKQSLQRLVNSHCKQFISGLIRQDTHSLFSLQSSQFSLRCGILIPASSRFHFSLDLFSIVNPFSKSRKSLNVISFIFLLNHLKVVFCDKTPFSLITIQYLVFGAKNNPYMIPALSP